MSKPLNTSDNLQPHNEDKPKQTQIQVIYQYLQEHVATASMVTAATGVPQKNVCRFKRLLEKAGQLWEVEKKICEHTGFKAWYICANQDIIRKRNTQLKLF